MPETLIPETVTLPGRAIIEAVSELDALSAFLCRINGNQETPFDVSILKVGWDLYAAAYGEEGLNVVRLTAAVTERSNAILRERLGHLAA